MKPSGFDNELYLKEQSEAILAGLKIQNLINSTLSSVEKYSSIITRPVFCPVLTPT